MHEKHRAVRVGDWKAVADAGKPWELYDLKSDRAEQLDLAAAKPEKLKELEQLWQRQADHFTELARKAAGGPAGSTTPPAKPTRPR
jgi:arylsulfatase